MHQDIASRVPDRVVVGCRRNASDGGRGGNVVGAFFKIGLQCLLELTDEFRTYRGAAFLIDVLAQGEGDNAALANIEREVLYLRANGQVKDSNHALPAWPMHRPAKLDHHVGIWQPFSVWGLCDRGKIGNEHCRVRNLVEDGGSYVGHAACALGIVIYFRAVCIIDSNLVGDLFHGVH